MITPKIKPPAEAIVRYAPIALPGSPGVKVGSKTGFSEAASTSLLYIPSTPPVIGLMKNTIDTKVRITIKIMTVCM